MARWAQAPAPAPAPANPIPAIPAEKPPPQLPPNQFHMHEITIPAAVTAVLLILPARCLAKIGDRREISDDRAAGVESSLQGSQGGGRLVLLTELDVDVADHVVGEVVADIEGFDLPEFGKLFEDVFEEVLEVLLDLAWVDGVALWVHAWSYHVGTLVHVGEKECRGDGWAVVETRAPVAVTTRADFEVEWAVHAVLFGTENGSKVLCHVWIGTVGDWIFVIVLLGGLCCACGVWNWKWKWKWEEENFSEFGTFVEYVA